ncbi:Hypothetical predicted protein [Podarcis lilfordi]|uniref:Uncharacterized protein n=1 Tax=Podarcis lilfordi TaxID=74358 RepID=A0AA35JYE5_9SAUR|nr:Hypothetical predicted protein [Podarcis lilfordi]
MGRCSHAQVFFIRVSGSSAVPNFPLWSGLQGILRSRRTPSGCSCYALFPDFTLLLVPPPLPPGFQLCF